MRDKIRTWFEFNSVGLYVVEEYKVASRGVEKKWSLMWEAVCVEVIVYSLILS